MALMVTAKLFLDQAISKENQLQFESAMKSETLSRITSKMNAITNKCGDNASKNKVYQELQAYGAQYEREIASLDTQLKLISKQKEGYEKMLQNGIEEATNLWCFG